MSQLGTTLLFLIEFSVSMSWKWALGAKKKMQVVWGGLVMQCWAADSQVLKGLTLSLSCYDTAC